MTTQDIRLKGIELIQKTINLQYNVNEGCIDDEEQLEINLERIEKFKVWAKENNQMQEVKHFFASHTFGYSLQFIASEMSSKFN